VIIDPLQRTQEEDSAVVHGGECPPQSLHPGRPETGPGLPGMTW